MSYGDTIKSSLDHSLQGRRIPGHVPPEGRGAARSGHGRGGRVRCPRRALLISFYVTVGSDIE